MMTACILILYVLAAFSPASYSSLFIIERTTNGNVIHYDARLDGNGKLHSGEPVVAYWTIGSEGGKREDLGFLERRRAWGFAVRKKTEGRYIMTVVSQKQIEIEVYQEAGAVRAETSIAGSRAYLRRIFVSIDGPLLFPRVNYIELFGSDVVSGAERYERIIPK